MKVFKVMIENNTAISATPADGLTHGDIGFKGDKETVEWLTLECRDKKTAMEIADRVVKMIWGKDDKK